MTGHDSADFETALLQAGELLLNGWGYNWYRAENLMRADDLLLRNQADQLLGDALAAFRRAEAVFRQKYMGPASRQRPLPDPERVAELHEFQAMLERLEALRTALRGAALPPDDRIARRHREEADLLSKLGRCDALLAASAQGLRTEAMSITPANLTGLAARMEPGLTELHDILQRRGDLLSIL